VLVVDDFCPTGSTYDVQRFHREADRLLRGQGNLSGRQRLRADSSLRATKAPRGLIISTGEDVPRGKSLQARLFIIEIGPNDIDWGVLTELQQLANDGLLATAMAGYIQWVAGRHDELVGHVGDRIKQMRATIASNASHRRTPTTVASLLVGYQTFLDFAREIEAISQREGDTLWECAVPACGTTARPPPGKRPGPALRGPSGGCYRQRTSTRGRRRRQGATGQREMGLA
jgi:hypothetical protein